MQEKLGLATGALHLSKFHWFLYASLWFAAHGALVSTVAWDFQVVKGWYQAFACFPQFTANRAKKALLQDKWIFPIQCWDQFALILAVNSLEISNPSQLSLSCLYVFFSPPFWFLGNIKWCWQALTSKNSVPWQLFKRLQRDVRNSNRNQQ